MVLRPVRSYNISAEKKKTVGHKISGSQRPLGVCHLPVSIQQKLRYFRIYRVLQQVPQHLTLRANSATLDGSHFALPTRM